MNNDLLKARDAQFDLSAIRGVKAKRRSGSVLRLNRRLKDSDIPKIRACYEANKGKRGIISAIARSVGVTPSAVWWILDGRSYN